MEKVAAPFFGSSPNRRLSLSCSTTATSRVPMAPWPDRGGVWALRRSEKTSKELEPLSSDPGPSSAFLERLPGPQRLPREKPQWPIHPLEPSEGDDVVRRRGIALELAVLQPEERRDEPAALGRRGPRGVEAREHEVLDLAAVRLPRHDFEVLAHEGRNLRGADRLRRIARLDRERELLLDLRFPGRHVEHGLREIQVPRPPLVPRWADVLVQVESSARLQPQREAAEEPLQLEDVVERGVEERGVVTVPGNEGVIEVPDAVVEAAGELLGVGRARGVLERLPRNVEGVDGFHQVAADRGPFERPGSAAPRDAALERLRDVHPPQPVERPLARRSRDAPVDRLAAQGMRHPEGGVARLVPVGVPVITRLLEEDAFGSHALSIRRASFRYPERSGRRSAARSQPLRAACASSAFRDPRRAGSSRQTPPSPPPPVASRSSRSARGTRARAARVRERRRPT